MKLSNLMQHHRQMRPITPTDLTIFFRQFAILISAGVPIIKSLDILEKTQEKLAMRHLLYSVKQEINTGKTLFQSFTSRSDHFDSFACRLIQIGEQTGKLEAILITIADVKEKNLALLARIRSALFYPAIIATAALIVTLGMFIFIIPRFADIFADAHISLPLFTRCLFNTAAFMQHAGYCFLLPPLLFLVIRSRVNLPQTIKTLTLQLPLIRHCVRQITFAWFMRNLAVTFNAGIPVIEGLKLTANISSHPEFISLVATLRNRVNAGLQLHQAMTELAVFPPLMTQMIKVGEESGMLAQVLDKTADFFASDIDRLLDRMSQLLEPLIMLVLGVVIGGIMIGIYIPIFRLGSAL